jgi:hypothetical protein
MRKQIILVALMGSTALLSGCNRSRLFSRQDYSEMQDPFMGGVAEAPPAAMADSGTGRSGKVTLGDMNAATSAVPEQRPMPVGPKPIQQVAGMVDPSAPSGAVSRAVYPADELQAGGTAVQHAVGEAPSRENVIRSYKGPALSGFLQGKGSAASDTSAAGIGGNAILQRNSATPGLVPGSALSPAAQAAALPGMSAEVEGFSSFLQESSDQVVKDVGQVAQDAKTTADSFSDFATQKKAQWQQQAHAAPGVAKQTVELAKDSVRQKKDTFIEQINSAAMTGTPLPPAKATAVRPTATGNITGTAATAGKATLTGPVEEAAGLENPFMEMPEFSSEDEAPPETSGAQSFDESFGGEGDWKPKEFTP